MSPSGSPAGKVPRRETRYLLTVDARVVFALPGPDRIALADGVTLENLSRSGFCLKIRSLAKERVPILAKAEERCSVLCRLPGLEGPSFLSGDITWIHLRFYAPQPDARLGVRLTNMMAEEERRLAGFFERFRAYG